MKGVAGGACQTSLSDGSSVSNGTCTVQVMAYATAEE